MQALKARVAQLEPLEAEAAVAKQRIAQLMQVLLSVDERMSELERAQQRRGGLVEIDGIAPTGVDASKRRRRDEAHSRT